MPLFRTTPELADYLRINLLPAETMKPNGVLDEWLAALTDTPKGPIITLMNVSTRFVIVSAVPNAMMMIRDMKDDLMTLLRAAGISDVAIKREADIFASSRFSTLTNPKHTAILDELRAVIALIPKQTTVFPNNFQLRDGLARHSYAGFGQPRYKAYLMLTEDPTLATPPPSTSGPRKLPKVPIINVRELAPRLMTLPPIPIIERGWWHEKNVPVYELTPVKRGVDEDDLRVLALHALRGETAQARHVALAKEHFDLGVIVGSRAFMHLKQDSFVAPFTLFDNRPFLRCLYGAASCSMRMHDPASAAELYEELISYDPTDPMAATGSLERAQEAADRKYT